ncbi:MAG: hypothetical protein IPF54_09025 [Draconibacterium sp.]|nr:hypothetical protein [Draconibacterium sp.]
MIKVVRIIFPVILVLLLSFGSNTHVHAQEKLTTIQGAVSYITGQNIYVKFENTEGIENGDSLFINKNEVLIPVLVVQHHSSISCLCNPVGDNSFQIGDLTVAKIKTKQKSEVAEIQIENQTEKDVSEKVISSISEIKSLRSTTKQDIAGTLSISSYSNFSNSESDNLHRFRYTFSMDAHNISNSKLSAETYISFSHKLNQWDLVQEDLNNALKIYSLALKYDFNNTTSMYVGRKINSKIANIGAVDGIQFQKDWNRFFVGVVGGTRPDFQNYGYNSKLLEYGAYIGQNQKVENGFVQSSLAFFEQRNDGNTDRRFCIFNTAIHL